MTAFKQVLNNLQAGQREEAMIGLEFVLRLDPSFVPATNLKRQLASSAKEIDLGDIIAQLQAPTTDAINGLLIEAVDDFNSREFLAAKAKVEKVLIDLPGHPEARELRDQIDKALKIEGQVGQFLIQAREALAAGDPQEAANFVMMAQALDPHHTGIASTLKEIDQTGGLAFSQGPPTGAPAEGAPVIDRGLGATDEAAAPGSPADQDEAYAVGFDTSDPFADVLEPAHGPPASVPEFGAGPGGDVSFPSMDDSADLFAVPFGAPSTHGHDEAAAERAGDDSSAAGHHRSEVEDVADSIEKLISRGQAALGNGDEPLAISIWSRVFLIKPNHPEAGHLIVDAKKSLAASEAKVEELLEKARDAYDEGEYDAAGLLVSRALALRPNHIAVTTLKEELERAQGSSIAPPRVSEDRTRSDTTPAAAGTSVSAQAPELPELDDALFSDIAAASVSPSDGFESTIAGTDDALFHDDDEPFEDFGGVSLIDRLRAKLPVRAVAIGTAALVVVLAGVWLGGRFLSSEPEVDEATAVNEVLVEADRLFKEHKVEEALHLLREFPASGLSQQRIDLRIAKYEESLAPPTPTAVPEHATRAQTLLDQGLWWSAYVTAGEGLAATPDDPGLLEIRTLILDSEPEAAVLENALRSRDYRTAVSIIEDLLIQYPGQGDLIVVLERSLFNAALAESRAYNLTGAEKHLTRLLELKPEDQEASRFLEFVQKYKVRAADMRLEIFIRSMDER